MPWNNDPETARLNREALLLVEERGALGLWSWDFEPRRLRWSAGMYRVLGLPAFSQEPSLELYNSIVHPEDRFDIRDQLNILNAIGDRHQRLIRKDGQMRRVRSVGRVIHSADGVPTRVSGVTFDVTERTRAEEAQQRESGLLDVVRELFGGSVWMTAADGTIIELTEWRLSAGQYAARHLGWARLDTIHPDDRAALQEAWAAALSTGRRFAADYRAQREGGYIGLLSRALPIRDPAGAVLAWVGYTASRPAPDTPDPLGGPEPTPTAGQIRGARGLLGWTGTDLAARSGLSFSTIRRAEADGERVVSRAAANTIRTTFAAAGVQFGVAPDGTTTLSLRAPERRQATKPIDARSRPRPRSSR